MVWEFIITLCDHHALCARGAFMSSVRTSASMGSTENERQRSGTSRDIRTPLAAGDERLDKVIGSIDAALRLADTTVGPVPCFTAHSTKLPLTLCMNLGIQAQKSADMFAPLAKLKRIEMVCELIVDTPPVMLSPDCFTFRVMGTLLSNAIKFTPPGGTVRVTLRGDETRAAIRVEDSGPGVPETIRHTIFDPFVDTDADMDTAGLGLAIARRLTAMQGGRLYLDESYREGAAFVIELPSVRSRNETTLTGGENGGYRP